MSKGHHDQQLLISAKLIAFELLSACRFGVPVCYRRLRTRMRFKALKAVCAGRTQVEVSQGMASPARRLSDGSRRMTMVLAWPQSISAMSLAHKTATYRAGHPEIEISARMRSWRRREPCIELAEPLVVRTARRYRMLEACRGAGDNLE